jgi:hypothetical protein
MVAVVSSGCVATGVFVVDVTADVIDYEGVGIDPCTVVLPMAFLHAIPV